MPMSEAARAAAGERMKRLHAEGKMKKKEVDPAVQEALAKAPITGISPNPAVDRWTGEPLPDVNELKQKMTATFKHSLEHPSNINIEVDWQNVPMLEGQKFYAHLKAEFEKAGTILNARSMAHVDGYTCFMCHKHFNGNPGFTDYSYIDPATGLSPRVDCCGELCVINYHKHRIDMRLGENLKRAAAERGE